MLIIQAVLSTKNTLESRRAVAAAVLCRFGFIQLLRCIRILRPIATSETSASLEKEAHIYTVKGHSESPQNWL